MDSSLTDSLAILVTAITSGAAASLQVTTSQAIKDAYGYFREEIVKKSTNKTVVQEVLREVEADPEGWKAPLKKTLVQEQIAQDENIIEAAKKMLMTLSAFSTENEHAHYSNQFHGSVQGIIQGGKDHHIEQYFDTPPHK